MSNLIGDAMGRMDENVDTAWHVRPFQDANTAQQFARKGRVPIEHSIHYLVDFGRVLYFLHRQFSLRDGRQASRIDDEDNFIL